MSLRASEQAQGGKGLELTSCSALSGRSAELPQGWVGARLQVGVYPRSRSVGPMRPTGRPSGSSTMA